MVRLYQKLFAQFNIRATGIILLFVQDAVLINYFGKVFFGEFVFFASLIQIIAIIGVCGQNNFIVFLSSKYKKCSQPSLIPHAVILGVLVALIGTIFLSLIVMVLNYMVFHKSEVSLPLVFVTSAMFGVFEVVRQTFRTISKEGITDSLSLICVPSTVIIVTLFFSFFDIDYLLDHPDYLYSFAVFVVLIITVVIFISEKPGFKDLPLKEFRKPFANSVSMNRLRLVWFKRGVPLTVSGFLQLSSNVLML